MTATVTWERNAAAGLAATKRLRDIQRRRDLLTTRVTVLKELLTELSPVDDADPYHAVFRLLIETEVERCPLLTDPGILWTEFRAEALANPRESPVVHDRWFTTGGSRPGAAVAPTAGGGCL